MFRLIRDEAFAYVRLGLLAPQKRRVSRNATGSAKVGVLFVPGVAANGSQFVSLRRAAEDHADWFGSFEYKSRNDPRELARKLAAHIAGLGGRVEQLVVVGHSLGGLLTRIALQETALPHVAGFVSICAPLEGTWRSKLALSKQLRQLRPDSALMTDVLAKADRLHPLRDRTVTIAARRDQFIEPFDAALLDGTKQIVLEDSAHAASLFDRRVREAVRDLVAQVASDR